MRPQWYELKIKALKFRKSGISIVKIESLLGIRRSTLSGWFKAIQLTGKQKERLLANKFKGLAKARKRAVVWHNAQKTARLLEAEEQAKSTLKSLKINKGYLDLALAMLYLGEGMKTSTGTAMGNSDPLILNFFIRGLQINYGVPLSKIKCILHIRADQDPLMLKKFWAKQLTLPLSNFTSVSIDKRTTGSTSYPSYKGVCVVSCGHSSIQRKLISLSRLFCQQIISERG